MAVVSASEKPIRARWPDGRLVLAGRDAVGFLDKTAESFGYRPAHIRDAIRRQSPAGLMILDLLGLTRESVMPRGRPADTPRAFLILGVVDDLLAKKCSEAEAFAKAPAYLNDPELRRRDGVGHGEDQVSGKGDHKPDMTPEAVREAYERGRSLMLSARWFRYADELDEFD